MTSTTLLWIFLGVIIIVAIAFLGLALSVRKLHAYDDQLKDRYDDLKAIPLTEKMDEIKKMHLNGQSQEIVDELEKKYDHVLSQVMDIQADFDELAESIDDYAHISHSKQFLDYLSGHLDEVSDDVNEVMNQLQELKDSEYKNSERIQASVDLLKELSHTLEGGEDTFDVAYEEVKKQFDHVTHTFDTFYDLNENGDPLEATRVLQRAEKEVNAAKAMIELVPQLVQVVVKNNAEYIDDLKDGYHRLVERKFKFKEDTGDISERIKVLEKERKEAIYHLERCDLDVVETSVKTMDDMIHQLYDDMQREVDAETYVNSKQSTVNEYLAHAYNNNRQLMIELDHTSQHFTFHDNELGRVRIFQNEIETMQRDNDTWTNAMEAHEAIYSEVEAFYKETLNILEDIENQQVAMDQLVKNMHQELKDAENSFDTFDFKMRCYKRYVEKHRLPGLPQEYLEYFFLVSDHIERLGEELAKMRVDTQRLNEYIDNIQREVTNVENQTNQMVDDASLAEQFIQYAGRYRTTHNISKDIDQSMTYFRSYQYSEARHLMQNVLSQIDEERVNKIISFYENDHEPI